MNKNNPIKNAIIICVIILIFIALYFLISKFTEKDLLEDEYLKKYEVNEYIPTYVSDEDMVQIYLNDYIYNMHYDLEGAYNSLDVEYRNKKFGNIENYKNYVYSLNYSTYKMLRYYKKEKEGYIIFGIYDNNNNFFAFKTRGVMQYTVYLDDYTVEI